MSTTAKKTKTLRLTSRAKSPKRPVKRIGAQAPATDLKATLEAAVEAVAAQAPVAPGLDGDAGTPAEQVGEPVQPKATKVTKPEPAPDTTADVLFGLLSRPERVTPRELMDATGLSHTALKAAVGKLLHEKNLKVALQRNPQPDPQDRKLTSYLYGVEPRA